MVNVAAMPLQKNHQEQDHGLPRHGPERLLALGEERQRQRAERAAMNQQQKQDKHERV
jgi:hypothetical protein